MQKKIKQSTEEKTAENYFPIGQEDMKITTEKKVKPTTSSKEEILKGSIEKEVKSSIPKEEILKTAVEKKHKAIDRKKLETVEKIPKRNGKKTNNFKKKNGKGIEYQPQKIKLKSSGGYELVITEKPQAANKIANALGKALQKNFNKVPYYELLRDGKRIVVACAVGHLFTLKQNSSGHSIPNFDISWVPNYLARKGDFTKRYYDTILKLVKDANSVTIATDYDVEGEVIGLNIVRFLCGQSDANRMKFSTLTSKELNEAYEKKSKTLNWGQAIAGETRHYLDWFYGINLSRALMNAIKSTGKFKIMSIGRVQGPALNMIVQKEKEIQEFKPEPFWQIFITVDDKKNQIELKYTKDIFDKKELTKFEDLKGKEVLVKTEKTTQEISPPVPFNLTALQTEAYSFYSITPSKTLQIAQSLYLAGLISYPRTSSQKLPDSVDYKSIKEKLASKLKLERLMKKEKPVEGEKTDPAHPSIYPTGNEPQGISEQETKIYNLIVRRFLSLFAEDAIVDRKTISTSIEKVGDFNAKGSQIRKKAWMEIYPSRTKENDIPDMEGKAKIVDSKIEQKETQPPKRYSQASIISELEKRNLGTKATRASILETLYDRGYVMEKSIEATPLGISLIKTLEKYSPVIIDEELTRKFESEMEEIQESKKQDLLKEEEKVIEEAKEAIIKISKDFEKHEKKIGLELVEANTEFQKQEREKNKLTQCPVCKKGDLVIMYSKKNRRFFVACNSYPACKTTYSLPPNGTAKKSEKICESCSFPMITIFRAGKRPWDLCFNPNCELNKKRLEEYYKKKDEESGANEGVSEER